MAFATTGRIPLGAAGGSLAGSYPNPTLVAVTAGGGLTGTYPALSVSGYTTEDYWKAVAASRLGLPATNLGWFWIDGKDFAYLGEWVNSSSGGGAAQNAEAPGRMTFTTTATNSRTFNFNLGNGTFGYPRLVNAAAATKKFAIGGRFNFPNAAAFDANSYAVVQLRGTSGYGVVIGYSYADSATKITAKTNASTARTFVSTVAASATDAYWIFVNDGSGTGRFSVNGEADVTSNGAVTFSETCWLNLYGQNGASDVEVNMDIENIWIATERS